MRWPPCSCCMLQIASVLGHAASLRSLADGLSPLDSCRLPAVAGRPYSPGLQNFVIFAIDAKASKNVPRWSAITLAVAPQPPRQAGGTRRRLRM